MILRERRTGARLRVGTGGQLNAAAVAAVESKRADSGTPGARAPAKGWLFLVAVVGSVGKYGDVGLIVFLDGRTSYGGLG